MDLLLSSASFWDRLERKNAGTSGNFHIFLQFNAFLCHKPLVYYRGQVGTMHASCFRGHARRDCFLLAALLQLSELLCCGKSLEGKVAREARASCKSPL